MGQNKKDRTRYFHQKVGQIVNALEFMEYNYQQLKRKLFIFTFTGVWAANHPQIGGPK